MLALLYILFGRDRMSITAGMLWLYNVVIDGNNLSVQDLLQPVVWDGVDYASSLADVDGN